MAAHTNDVGSGAGRRSCRYSALLQLCCISVAGNLFAGTSVQILTPEEVLSLLAFLGQKYQFWHLRAPGAVVALMSAGALAHGGAAADGETCVDLALKGKHGSILVHMLQVC